MSTKDSKLQSSNDGQRRMGARLSLPATLRHGKGERNSTLGMNFLSPAPRAFNTFLAANNQF